ncbi:MAG TPA: ferrochelatase [Nocardioidaceae bacterium]|jgi:ferrochelatase
MSHPRDVEDGELATGVSTSSTTGLPRDAAPYDALLLVSFGGPEKPGDVMPFLENVTRGRGVPRERLEQVAQHYFDLGGRSPINDQCRELVAAIEADFKECGLDVPVYWGNRNWEPYLSDTVATMRGDGVRRAVCFVTSAYASYSGCRQYRENLYEAVADVADAPRLDKLRHYFNHPGFVEAFVDSTSAGLANVPAQHRQHAHLVFVTHSIPVAMADTAGPDGGAYVAQHLSVASLVSTAVQQQTGVKHPWELVYCSRSGPAQVPWLEPDVNDHLRRLASDGVRAVVIVPLGFVSDHMEVVYDLDTEAAQTAGDLGLEFVRAATPGVHPAFVATVRDLLLERAARERGERVVPAAFGGLPAAWDVCRAGCCPNPRASRPALCETPA